MPRTSPNGTPPQQSQPQRLQPPTRRDRRRRAAPAGRRASSTAAALLTCGGAALALAFAAAAVPQRAAFAQEPGVDPGTQLNRQADPEQAAEEDAAAAAAAAKRRNDTIFGVVALLVMVGAATGIGFYVRRLDKPAPVVDDPVYPGAAGERPSSVNAGRPAVPAGSTMVLTEEQMSGVAAAQSAGPATAVLPSVAKAAPPAPADAAAAPVTTSSTPVLPVAPADPAPAAPAVPIAPTPAPAAPAAPVFATAAAAPAATPVGEDRPTLVKPRSGAVAPVPPAVLEFVGGPAAGRKQALEGFREAVLGRANDADIVVPDAEVSRRHARITRTDDGTYALVDMASANGLYVNGERVFQATLREGDRVRIGQSEMVFRGGGEGAAS